MKKIMLILGLLVFVAFTATAQRGHVKTLAVDTLKGDNNKTLAEIPATGSYNQLYISVKVDRISTAAGGTLYLKAGIDSASTLVMNSGIAPSFEFAPNDTLATADVATQYWDISITEPGPTMYHIFGDGDASDTIKVTTSYILK